MPILMPKGAFKPKLTTGEPSAPPPAPAPSPAKPALKPLVKAMAKPQSPPTGVVAKPPVKPALPFLKRGDEAKKAMQKEEKKAEQKKILAENNVYEWWLAPDASGSCTFLDGNLKDGVLDISYYYDHNMFLNGRWGNHFICTSDTEPCPLCEGGNEPDYVGVLSVIDHTEYVSKKDGKTKTDNRKLFRAKRDTVKLLLEKAVKRGGLRGTRWDVKRIGDKSPRVGSDFDFTEKLTEAELKTKYGKVPTLKKDKPYEDHSKPIDYEKFLGSIYQPAAELRKMGFGDTSAAPVGSETAAEEDYQM